MLAPDLSEISIGVLSLKQEVKSTKENQERLRGEFEGLKQSFAISTSNVSDQTTAVSTSIQAPDLASTVKEIARAVSRNPDLRGAGEYAGGTDPDYTLILGEVVITLARLQFLLGEKPLRGDPSPLAIKFWVINLGDDDGMMIPADLQLKAQVFQT